MSGMEPMLLLLVGGIAGGIAFVLVGLLDIARQRSEQAAERKEVPVRARHDDRRGRIDDALAASPTLRRAVEVTADLAGRRGALGSVERKLRAADVPIRPAEVILFNVVLAVFAPLAIFLLTQSPVKAAFSFLVAAAGPSLALKVVVGRRRKKFNAQLPDALTTLAGSLRAGRSIGQAMEVISRELPDPMGRELRKVVAEVRLGRSLHETLEDAADRVGSADFRWAVLAMQIQAEVGGNLAELLDQVSATMRERARMQGEVKALTAEGRASALMLVIMVPALGLAMAAMNPDYMRPLLTTSTGRILVGISGVMIGGGYLWMNSMVKIDV
jgi:tight adherence protein B